MSGLELQLITGAVVGLGAGYVGAFMILRRMSLVGDALSHVALPGIALALIYHVNPFIGAFAALFIAIAGIWAIERRTHLPSETLVGIFFTLSLALGILLTPEPELLEALFGDIGAVTRTDVIMSSILVIGIIITTFIISRSLILSTVSKDLTRSMGINVDTVNFIFLFMVAIVVALGLKIAGTLLMGSLVIVPAAAARNIGRNLSQFAVFAMIFGALSGLLGVAIALYIDLPAGPIVVLTSGVIFLISLLFKR